MATLSNIDTPASLDAALAEPGLLLLEFYTQSCIICRRIEPMVAAVAQTSGGALRAHKIDAEAHLDFAARHDIRGVPTVLLFRNGEVVGRQSGFLTASMLRDWISPHASS
jgi:thioredoxin 1